MNQIDNTIFFILAIAKHFNGASVVAITEDTDTTAAIMIKTITDLKYEIVGQQMKLETIFVNGRRQDLVSMIISEFSDIDMIDMDEVLKERTEALNTAFGGGWDIVEWIEE